MTRIDWAKDKRNHQAEDARRTEARTTNQRAAQRARVTRDEAMRRFVATHELSCFRCGGTRNRWAKTGTSRRGPWAICTSCVTREYP